MELKYPILHGISVILKVIAIIIVVVGIGVGIALIGAALLAHRSNF